MPSIALAMLTTVAVIGGWQLAARGYPVLDFILSLAIALYVMFLVYNLFSQCIPILVDGTYLDHEKIIQAIEQLDNVISVKRLRSRIIAHGVFVDIIVTVNRHLSTQESHAIADCIEKKLLDRRCCDTY